MGTSSGKELKTVTPFDPNAPIDDPQSRPGNTNDNYAFSPDRGYSDNLDNISALNRTSSGGGFNFDITEGQTRRNLLADCDNECSAVCDFIFVSGAKVAMSYDTLVKYNVSRIINCAVTVVDNYFIGNPRFTYLSLNLVDSRVDDLSWFFCEVIKFIEKGRLAGQKTLIHCEKGVSRSCSFAIVYFMWAQGIGWRESFDIVKRGRPICAPNTGFWCNLIEMSELLNGNTKNTTLLFRCAHHLAHDMITPVLKLCINQETRKVLMPRTSLLDPRGIFVLRCGTNTQNSRLFVWAGSNSSSNALTEAIRLAHLMINILSMAGGVTIVQQNTETDEFRREIMDDGPFDHRCNAVDRIIFDDLYMADPIIISRQGTPLTKVRSGAVLPDPATDNAKVGSPDPASRTTTAGTNVSSLDRKQKPHRQPQPQLDAQSKDVDVFVKVRRSSRESAGALAMSSSLNSNVSAASLETDRLIATVNALTAAKNTPSGGGKRPVNPNSNSSGAVDARTSPTAIGKFSGKRNAEEMEIDSPNDNLSPLDEDLPSPKYQISNPPSLEVSGENFESFRHQSDVSALNLFVDSCRIGGNSVDSHDANASLEHSTESKSEFTAKLKTLGVSLHLPTSQVHDPQNNYLSIVDKAAEIRQPEKSGGTGLSSSGKYEIWTGHSAASVGSTTNSSVSMAGGKVVSDSLETVKELHPDHVDSPHVVTHREKPLLFLATPSEDIPGWGEYVWLPMGVYDDEDLQEEVMLLLLCPKGTHYLWVGSTFQIPSTDSPVIKKKVSQGSFDDLSDDDGMNVCGTMNSADKELLQWARKVDDSTIPQKNKSDIFKTECISIQRQREECDPFWTAFYEGM